MENIGYYNGETGPIEEMRLPMDDRASWFGDGVYDATCAINHRLLFPGEHIERFFKSAALLEMTPPVSREALAELLRSLSLKVDGPNQLVYWQLTRGTAPREHAFPSVKPNLWAFIRPYPAPDVRQKIRLITVEDTRFFHCNIKTLNLIPNVLAGEKARLADCQEAVFHRGERVTECAHSNVHILTRGSLQTAPADNLILAGVARAHIITQCKALGIPVKEEPFTVQEMMAADEVLVSSSGTFCLSASHIDGKQVGGKAGEILSKLQDAVMEEVRRATQTPDRLLNSI
jgi:D-alanine transaminase